MPYRQLLRSLLIVSLLVQNFTGFAQAVSSISQFIDSAKTIELVTVDHSQQHWCDLIGVKEGLNQIEVCDLEETDSEQEDDRENDDDPAKQLIVAIQALEFEYRCFVRLHTLKEMKLVYNSPVANHDVVRC